MRIFELVVAMPRYDDTILHKSPTAMSASRIPASLLSACASSSRRTLSSSTAPSRCFSSAAPLYAAPAPRSHVVPEAHSAAGTQVPRTITEQAEQYPCHPLNAFFPTISYEVPDLSKGFNDDGTPKSKRGVRGPAGIDVEDDIKASNDYRRAWMASELRRKSSVELHQLWYILLIERNKLASSSEELRRAMGRMIAENLIDEGITKKLQKVRRRRLRRDALEVCDEVTGG